MCHKTKPNQLHLDVKVLREWMVRFLLYAGCGGIWSFSYFHSSLLRVIQPI